MRRTLREKEPERPSTRVSTLGDDELTTTAKRRGLEPPKLVNLLRGDLDWIVMKCLEKDRARRYETANGLASDIQRHLKNEPVVACPPNNLYKFQKLVRRNKLAFAAGAGIAAALVIGLAIALWQSIEKTRAFEQVKIEAAKSQQVAEFLKDMLAGVGPSKALGRDTKMLREILENTARRLDGLTNQPAVEADLREILGEVYREPAEYTNAVAMHQRALELRKRLHGEERPAVAASLNNLGRVLHEQGKLAEAEAIHRQALAMRRKLLGNEHVASSLNNLAVVLESQRKLVEAETTQREALAMQRKLFGNEHLNVADSLHNLAVMLHGQGKLSEAEAIHREALALTRKLLGNEHPHVALSLVNLAALLSEQGNFSEAETLHREALAMQKKLFGNEHPSVAHSLERLAATLKEQGRKDEAESLFREALEMDRKLLGNEHPKVAVALNNLGTVLFDQGKLAEAEATYREALALDRKIFGNEHPSVAATLGNLGLALHKQGKLAEAETMMREALEIQRKYLGNENPGIAVTLNNLARLLQEQGKLTDAAVLLREAVALLRQQSGGDTKHATPALGRALPNLAGVLLELGQLAEARSLAEDAITLCRRHSDWGVNDQSAAFDVLGKVIAEQGNLVEAEAVQSELLAMLRKRAPDNPLIAAALAELAVTLIAEQKFTAAEPIARECFEFRQRNYPNGWSAFSARVLLGECLLGQKKYIDAESLLLSGYGGLEQRRDKPVSSAYRRQPQLKRALELLVQLYEETGRADQAAEWKLKLEEFNKATAKTK
jgi:tetratricopeptide (TPR) repeat protein